MNLKRLSTALILVLLLLQLMTTQAQPLRVPAGAYNTAFGQPARAIHIYKYVDNAGRVIYSSKPPNDDVRVQQIRIDKAPSDASTEATRQRYEKIRESAQMLGDARLQREQARKEQERKRLEWQALLNRAKPPAVKKREVIVTHPRWPWRPWPEAGHHHDKFRPGGTSGVRGPGTFSTPPSSFPDMFGGPVR